MKVFKQLLKELKEATMSNLDFVIDQLSNSMEFYDEDDFVELLQQELGASPAVGKKVWDDYQEMDTIEKFENSAKDWEEFLSGFGLG
jgi:hypothetical protein